MFTRKSVLTFLYLSSTFLFISNPAHPQTCTQPFVLRQETCPSGISTCTTKASTLTYQELDRDIINTVNMCNGPGKFTWPATGSAGIFAVTSGGVVSITTDDDTPDNDSEVPDAHTMNGGTLSGTNTVTGILNLDGGTEGHLIFPASTTLPATCTLGDSYWDTDADSDGSFYICRATNVWKEVDDDGGAGGGAPTDAVYLTLSTNATLTNERVYTTGVGLNGVDAGAGSSFTISFWTGDTLASNPTYSTEDVVFTKDGTGGGLLFEGVTADAFEGLIQWNPTTSDKTITIPDITGTLVTTGDTGSVTGTMILDNTIGLATDTVGNYAAGDAEAGNATGLACTTCVDASDIASDAITEAKLDMMDSPADEECLTYESSNGRGEWQSCGGGGSSIDPTTQPDMWDELCGRHTTENVYGALGWTSFGGNGTGAVTAETSHPCIQSLFTTTTSGNVQALGLGKFSTDDQFRVSDLDRVIFVVKLDNVTNSEFRVGFMDDVSSTTGGDGAMIDFDASADDSLRCITRQGGTTTANLDTAAFAANTWYQLEIERTSGGVYNCYANGVNFASNSTNVPTGITNIGFAVETKTTAQRTLSMDYFRLKIKTITRF